MNKERILLDACYVIARDCRTILDGDDMSGMSDNELFGAMLKTVTTAVDSFHEKNKMDAAEFAEAVGRVCVDHGFTILTYRGEPGLWVEPADTHCDIDGFVKSMIESIHANKLLPGKLSEKHVKFAEQDGI